MIIIDTREEEKKIGNYLKKRVIAKEEMLIVGDYLVIGKDKGLLIERKNVMDLISSMNDGRLWEQLEKMKGFVSYKEDDSIYELDKELLVEGSLSLLSPYVRSKIEGREVRGSNEKSIIGRLHTILWKWNIPIIFTGNWYQSALYLEWLDDYLGREKERKIHKWAITIDVNLPIEKQAIGMLSTVAGIKTSCAILKEFKSLKNLALNIDKKELFENIKIGNRKISKSTIERLISILNADCSKESEVLLSK